MKIFNPNLHYKLKSSSNWLKLLGIFIYIFINSTYIFKYGSRFFSENICWSLIIIYALLIIGYCKFLYRIFIKLNNWIKIALIILILSGLVIAQLNMDPYSINGDRWSAIHNFIHDLFRGSFPYAAQTHLGGYGSPFPVWQLYHIPFYLIGCVGLSIVFSTLIFIDSLRRLYGLSFAFIGFILLACSPAFIFEALAWSDMITNFLICISLILYFKHFNVNLYNHCIFISVIFGLLAATRLSAIIPFLIYFIPSFFHINIKKKLICIIVPILVFSLIFLPFLFWNGEMLLFFEHNPFSLQTRQGHLTDFIIYIPLGLWMIFSWKNNFSKYLFNTSFLLFMFIGVNFIHNIYVYNTWNHWLFTTLDITYFNMALPFTISFIISSLSDSLLKKTSKELNVDFMTFQDIKSHDKNPLLSNIVREDTFIN